MNRFSRLTGRLLILTEQVLNVVVFFALAAAAVTIVIEAIHDLNNAHSPVLVLLSNALLLIVVKEIIWTVVRFFKKERFTLSPFLYIGVMSAVREILFLSVEKSLERTSVISLSLEMLANAGVIFLLVAAYYLFKKARVQAGEI